MINKFKQSRLKTLQDTHVKILEDRFLFAARRREKMLEKDPNLTDNDLWAVDYDIATKKRDLEIAQDNQRKERRQQQQHSINQQ